MSALSGAAFLLGACIEDPGPAQPLPEADFQAFVFQVEPILSNRCGLAACHGTPERPLALFVVPHHRLGAETSDLLNPDESAANFNRARSFLIGLDAPADSPLLTAPLAKDAGGTFHRPGPTFETTIDDEYQVILSWIEDALDGGAE